MPGTLPGGIPANLHKILDWILPHPKNNPNWDPNSVPVQSQMGSCPFYQRSCLLSTSGMMDPSHEYKASYKKSQVTPTRTILKVFETCVQRTEHRICINHNQACAPKRPISHLENCEMNGDFWNYRETCIGEQFEVGAIRVVA